MKHGNNKNLPDISVSLDIEVVKVVCVLNLAKVWTLESLDDFRLHYPGYMSRQQRQEKTFLMAKPQRKVAVLQGVQAAR